MYGIIWDDRWSIGDELIDSQHKELVKLVNELVISCDNKKADISAALSFLVQYTITHFDDEEKLQQSCGFPHYEEHKQMHDNLKSIAGRLVAEHDEFGSTSKLQDALRNILMKWLVDHITVEDKKIGDYIWYQKSRKAFILPSTYTE